MKKGFAEKRLKQANVLSVRGNILTPMILLTVICAAAILMSSILLFRMELDHSINDKINVASVVAENKIASFKSQSHMAAIIMAGNKELIGAIKSNDRDKILAAAIKLPDPAKVDFCAVLDSEGTVLARTHDPERYGDSLVLENNVAAALAGKTETFIEHGTSMLLSVRTGAPVYDEDGSIIGVVTLGYRLDTEDFIKKLKAETGCEATIFLGDERIATTITDESGTYAIGTTAEADVSERVLNGEPYVGRLNVLGREIAAKYTPLYGVDGEIVGMMLVGKYTDEDMGKMIFFVTSGALITLLILAAVIIIAIFITKTIDLRLENMNRTAHEAEALTQKMLNTAPFVVTIFNTGLEVINTNEAAERLFDLSDRMEYVKRFFEFSPEYQPDGKLSRGKALEHIKRAFEDGHFRFEWIHQKLNGELIPCEIMLMRVDNRGEPIVVGYSRDLRDEKKMLLEMRESEERIQLLLDTAPFGINFINEHWQNLVVNKEALRLLGLSCAQEYIDKFKGEISPEYQPDGRLSCEKGPQMIKKAFDEGYVRYEWMHKKPDGEPLPCEVTMVRTKHKGNYVLAGYTRDLRAEKEMLKQIREADRNRQALLESMETMIVITGLEDDKIIYMNERMKETLGFDDSIVGDVCWKHFNQDMDGRCGICPKNNPEFTGETYPWEFHNPNINRDFRIVSSIIDWPDGSKVFLEQINDITELKAAIAEKNALINLSNTLNGLDSMISVTDPDTDELLFMNDTMKRIFRIEGDYTGQKCHETLWNFDKRCAFCPCDRLDVNPDDVVIWEEMHGTSSRIYRSYSRYIDWPGKKKVHLQNAIDITDLKQTQNDLANQNLRLNLLVSSMNVGLWDRFIDLSAEFADGETEIWWSCEFRKLLGFSDENDFPNKISSWLDRVHPDDLSNTIAIMEAHLGDKTGKTPYDVINRMRLKNGQYRWFRSFGTTLRDDEGNPLRVAGATEDITERIEAEREIAEKNELNQIMFNNAPVGLTVYGENNKFIDCNENVLKMFGATKEFYSVFFGSKVFSPEYQPDGSKSIEKAYDIIKRVMNGEIIKTEWLHSTPTGDPLPVELTMTRVKQGDEYVGLSYVYDMRKQNKLKEELKSALYKAEIANKAKSAFLANMSHEIRTPMNAILGITEMQLQNEALLPQTEEALGKIYESGNLLLNIINDILDLSKIEAGKLEVLPVKYDIPSLINDVVQLTSLRYESKPLKFNLELDKDTPINLIGDELRIKQVLNNILSNAFKYTEKGTVSLSVFPEAEKDGGKVVIVFRIGDTGQGMTPEQLGTLFDEYTRFNIEANRTTIGTGLGMGITKRLLDLMDGEIFVESEVGKGSVFTVRIPQKRVDQAVCGPEI
ncbi:MAG: PAS domain S-box protein, partial [Oscillospiraceae bacterium]|nr:PAS domain S-box protein [Oscillospiraceae bacterium]